MLIYKGLAAQSMRLPKSSGSKSDWIVDWNDPFVAKAVAHSHSFAE